MSGKKPINKSNEGFSLVEGLIGMVIIAFVLISILSTLTHQHMTARRDADKNVAIMLAEEQFQEMIKFHAQELTEYAKSLKDEGYLEEFIIHKKDEFAYFERDQEQTNQFKRTTIFETDQFSEFVTIKVMVEYGKRSGMKSFPFRVTLTTGRTLYRGVRGQ